MAGPIGSSYPGTQVVLSFLAFFAAVVYRSASARRRREGDIESKNRLADVAVAATAAVVIVVILWAIWSHR
jgi:hypothetical protein